MKRHISASIIGNILEWYEFSLFAYLAPLISQLFFPNQNRFVSLLSTLLVFAAGFLIRPLGSIVLGHLGDRWGRANTLKLTIFLMSVSSILTGFLPTYESIGILAPVLLIICRLLQGFCIGGEFAGSMIYLSESAQGKHRALISSMTNNGSNIGVLIAIASCAALTQVLGLEKLAAFGWRWLFMTGGILGLIGLWWRRYLIESETFHELQKNISESYFPLLYVLRNQKMKMLQVFLLLVVSACGSYTLMGYLSTYLHEFLNLPLQAAYTMQTIFIVLSLLLVPLFAVISDRFGRKPVLYFSLIGYLVFTLPSFQYLQQHPQWWVMLPMIIFYSAEQAVTPAAIVELFPGKGRYTGVSLAYNLSMALVGGFAAAINTWLIHTFHNNLMIVYYVMISAAVSLMIVRFCLPDEFGVESNLTEVC